MIKIIDEHFKNLDLFKNFCKNDSFGTRIYSHYLCYGYEYDFVDFWLQINNDNIVTAVFCKIHNEIILSTDGLADFDEISSFLKFQSKSSITFDYKFKNQISVDSGVISFGDILIYRNNEEFSSAFEMITPSLKEYHNLLLSCESSDFFVPSYLDFLADVSRRQQRSLCDICGVFCDDLLVSGAMTVSYTDFSVILGAVATHPDYRKRGYAGCIVRSLAEKYKADRSVYIYTTIRKNTLFYSSIGFSECGKWIKYTYGG